jgi:valyl-tRNA synthetase
MSGVVGHPDFDPVAARLTLNRWIVGEVARTRDAVTSGIEEHRYNEAAAALYGFVWHVFCDWHLEFIKPVLAGDDEAAATETRHVTAWVLDQILLLLHPFMPFLTEELWQRTGGEGQPRDSALIVAPWPDYEGLGDASADAEIGWVIELVSAIRSVRSEMNVPAAARIACVIAGANAETRRRASHWQAEITRLARLENLAFADRVPEGAAHIVLGEATVALPLAGVIDLGAERARLEKDLDRTATDIAAINARLGNQGFLAKAPEEVVEEARDRRTNLEARKAKIAEALNRLQAAE